MAEAGGESGSAQLMAVVVVARHWEAGRARKGGAEEAARDGSGTRGGDARHERA